MTPREARRRFASLPVARLATADATGRPHLVPMVFALDGDTVAGAVDHKPKRTAALRRLANIAANPHVCLLVDHYEEDWTRLWWARADGTARVTDAAGPEGSRALRLLCERYPQYRDRTPGGPVVLVSVHRWSGWAAGAGMHGAIPDAEAGGGTSP